MISIGGKLISPVHVVSAEIETRHYMNGTSSWLVVHMDDGQRMRIEHGYGFDAYAALDNIRDATLALGTQ